MNKSVKNTQSLCHSFIKDGSKTLETWGKETLYSLPKIATIISSASTLALMNNISSAQAYSTFFGEDLNPGTVNANPPLVSFPNASQAEADFISQLIGVGTEDFESFATTAASPFDLVFPGAGTATLLGTGSINTDSSSDSINSGIHPVSGTQNWISFVGDGGFNISFTEPIGALGFYFTDLETTQLNLQLTLSNGTIQNLIIPNSTLSDNPPANSASIFYHGLIADTSDEVFTNITFTFLDDSTANDGIGLDDLTIGTLEQTQAVPEPSSLLGLGILGVVGLLATKKK